MTELLFACRPATEKIDPSDDELPEVKVSNYITTFTNLVENYRLKAEHFQAGQISRLIAPRRELTSDSEILDTVGGQHIEFVQTPVQVNPPFQPTWTKKTSEFIDSEILSLLGKSVIQKWFIPHDLEFKVFESVSR